MMSSRTSSSETTPLLGSTTTTTTTTTSSSSNNGGGGSTIPIIPRSRRQGLYDFLEAKTTAGQRYEYFVMVLIALNVICFVAASLFVEEYQPDVPWAQRGVICGNWCDALWFGNYRDNALGWLNAGATSVLELITIAVFTVEYLCRLATCDLESSRFQGVGRLRYLPTFFSMVDLVSTVPFYVDVFLLRSTDLAGSAFLRMFRLLRMMRVEGRYDTALTMVDDVWDAQKGILGTALFVGFTTWMTVSALYYLVERNNHDMIYCGHSHCGTDVDTSLCVFDEWGLVDCTDAGCEATEEFPVPCYNLFESIPVASFVSLLNLFGEFPLLDQHHTGGMIVGTITAIVAVAVFALPAGIIGNGFETEIEKRRQTADDSPIQERGLVTEGFQANSATTRGWWYNMLHAQTLPGATELDTFINFLIVATSLTFMIGTVPLPGSAGTLLDVFEFFAVVVFTLEYLLRVYSIREDPKCSNGVHSYVTSFLPGMDFLSFAPYWVAVVSTGSLLGGDLIWVKSLRLLRIFRFEKYTHAFTSFDDVLSRNMDVMFVTLFTALLIWVFFGAFLYYTERDNLDPEMASNYNTIPNSLWMTLLNLSGEAPLAQYSVPGKVASGLLGMFATGVFGIPIGILGAGFEQVVEEENEDDERELRRSAPSATDSQTSLLGSSFEQSCYKFVNGIGSSIARKFETTIYVLIFVAVGIGIIQTVDGHENDFAELELFSVIVFTLEYVIRFLGVGADPEFAVGRNGFTARVRHIFSFYSLVDLLAIVPYFLARALPGGVVDQYDDYLRMCRIIRLIKLDKYFPSITLIDDVIRLKYTSLKVAFYAAITLWILFAGLIFLFEHDDDSNELDDAVPKYGCDEDCTMSDRFQNFFDSMVYIGIHLTGDYPITTYNWPARFVNFFMVISAVGVVSIPSALVASGFVEIVQSKAKARGEGNDAADAGGTTGDDWYEIQLRELRGVDPPPSPFGSKVDAWQNSINDFLNGTEGVDGQRRHTTASYCMRVFIFLLIIANIVAVLAESDPNIDKSVGNQPGNFFDRFEAISVMIFAAEYLCRLFCAPKNRESLYSTRVYATTFFGIVDFLSTAPWFIEQALFLTGSVHADSDSARVFRIFRIFRILQLEDFVTAFSKLDNVFRASKDVLKATGLMALIIWVGCSALFYIFEENNPNWRHCDESIPPVSNDPDAPGCFDFYSTAECNEFYPGLCEQKVFTNMLNTMYLTSVFLGGEWGVVDFTWPGRFVCLFLCVVGIGLYAIPVGALFDSFGAVLGMDGDEDEEDDD